MTENMSKDAIIHALRDKRRPSLGGSSLAGCKKRISNSFIKWVLY
jgi:hypothetical protein